MVVTVTFDRAEIEIIITQRRESVYVTMEC